ncbi:MAG: hypothetical protein IPH13_14190 [Planctomycetes bacterium]|nr:hypothetical protein [Planctomycetota bacterium]MCC7171193.1 hypothetical protein [Planctomycetota bacterium]
MNPSAHDPQDEFERALDALRSDDPPAPRATLRAEILDRFPARRTAPRFDLRRAAGFTLAAAALALFAFVLARRDAPADVGSNELAALPSSRALMLELDALARRIEALPRPSAPAPEPFDDPADDPEFARLVVARGYEDFDVERARDRYRELSATSPDGPVRDVALARLEVLGR